MPTNLPTNATEVDIRAQKDNAWGKVRLTPNVEIGDTVTFEAKPNVGDDHVITGDVTDIDEDEHGHEIVTLETDDDYIRINKTTLKAAVEVDDTSDLKSHKITDDGRQYIRVNLAHVTAFVHEETEDSEEELVADGGTATPVTDDDIEDAIESHDDPDDPDSLTVADVRELLAIVQRDAEELWDERMHDIERDNARVITDTGDTIVLSTGEHKIYDDILDNIASEFTDVEYDGIAADVVSAAMHNAANRLADYDWGVSYPLVIAKPDGARQGEAYTVAVINSLLRRGLSPGQAWAYYGVEIRGDSRNAWASRCGYSDHSAVSEAVRKAKSKLP